MRYDEVTSSLCYPVLTIKRRKGQLCVTPKIIHHVLQEFIIIIFPGKLHSHSHMHPSVENVTFRHFKLP